MASSRKHYEQLGIEFELVINSPLGNAQKINNLVVEFSLFEDIFSPFMKMEVLIADGIGLIDKLPIVGDETLIFSRRDPVGGKYTIQAFDVYKVTDRSNARERLQQYVLHAITKEATKNLTQEIYEPFIKQPPHTMVSSVFNKYMKVFRKSIDVEASDNLYSKIGHGHQPSRFIAEIAKECRSTKYPKHPTYLFYEDKDQFNFKTIGSLLEQGPVAEYKLGVPLDEDYFLQGPSFNIISYTVRNEFDILSQLYDGMFLNEVNYIDPILKRFKVDPVPEPKKQQFNYIDQFGELKHITADGGNKFITPNGYVASAERKGGGHRRLFTTQIQEDGEDYPTIGYLAGRVDGDMALSAPRLKQDWIAKSIHEVRNINSHVVDITVPGDQTNIKAGVVISIKISQPTQLESETEKFLFLYGQNNPTFLVTSVRQLYKMETDSLVTIMTCAKESFGAAPAAKTFDNSNPEPG